MVDRDKLHWELESAGRVYQRCSQRTKVHHWYVLPSLYSRSLNSLREGCHVERYRYQPDDIVMLTDDSRNPRQIPTRANTIQAMHWLVSNAQPDDALFFH